MSTKNKVNNEMNLNPFHDRHGLIYARVSSKRQETEGSGLQSQEDRCKAELKRIKVPYVRTFKESYTGAGDFSKRPSMTELLDYIDANPLRKFIVIFDDLKRFARDVEFHIKLRAAFRARDVILQSPNYNFDETAEGEFVELIMAGQAQLERKQNKRQVIQKQKARLEAGYWPFGAKKGYDQVKHPEHGKLSVPNKEGWEVLKPALEWFGDGTFIRKIDACEYLVKKGFWKKQHFSAYIEKFTEILRNPFYMGDVEYLPWDVARRKGKHVGIISKETFDLIQKRLDKNGVTKTIRRDTSEDFPLRGLVSCSVCGNSLTAAWTTARQKLFPYYLCQNGHCEFSKKSIQKKVIEDEFKTLLEKTRLKKELSVLVQKIFDEVWQEEIGGMKKEESVLARKKSDLRNKSKELTDLVCKAKNEKLKMAYEDRLEEVLQELSVASSAVPLKQTDLSIPYRNALDIAVGLIENPYPVWEKMSVLDKHQLFFFIFDEKLRYNKKEGYRNDNLPSVARLFEEFATSDYHDVEVPTSKPDAKKELKWFYNA